jgi:hypothetical protein
MSIQVNYSGTKYRSVTVYGNTQPACTYTVSIADTYENDLSIRFDFRPPRRGQNMGDSSVFGGEIRIPKRQAMAFAALILLYPYLAESEEPERVEVDIDEDNDASLSSSVELDHLAEGLVRQVRRMWSTCSTESRGRRRKAEEPVFLATSVDF